MNTAAPIAILSDPSGEAPLIAAATWVQQMLLGTVASVIAILAVASVGLLMLSGRIAVRQAATIVLGCFILFGAPAIAAGLIALMEQTQTTPSATVRAPPPAPPPVIEQPSPRQSNDPYAGASLTLG